LAKFRSKLLTGIALQHRQVSLALSNYITLSGELFDESGKFRVELAKHRREVEIARWKSPFLIKTFAVYRLVISEAGDYC